MKESCKKKLARSTWAGHVEKLVKNNWQREQMPRKRRGNGREEDRNCDGGLHYRKSGRTMKNIIDRSDWRMLTENIVRTIERKKKGNGKGIDGIIFLNMNFIHIKNKNNKMQFDLRLVTGKLLF